MFILVLIHLTRSSANNQIAGVSRKLYLQNKNYNSKQILRFPVNIAHIDDSCSTFDCRLQFPEIDDLFPSAKQGILSKSISYQSKTFHGISFHVYNNPYEIRSSLHYEYTRADLFTDEHEQAETRSFASISKFLYRAYYFSIIIFLFHLFYVYFKNKCFSTHNIKECNNIK